MGSRRPPICRYVTQPNFGPKLPQKGASMENFTSKHPLFKNAFESWLSTRQIDPYESKYVDGFHPISKFTVDSAHAQRE